MCQLYLNKTEEIYTLHVLAKWEKLIQTSERWDKVFEDLSTGPALSAMLIIIVDGVASASELTNCAGLRMLGNFSGTEFANQ